MKDNKHIQSFNEHQENLNISDVSDSNFKSMINRLSYSFNDRPEFIFGTVTNKCTVKIEGTPYRLIISNNGRVYIKGKGTDTDGDVRYYKNYEELVNILLLYADDLY